MVAIYMFIWNRGYIYISMHTWFICTFDAMLFDYSMQLCMWGNLWKVLCTCCIGATFTLQLVNEKKGSSGVPIQYGQSIKVSASLCIILFWLDHFQQSNNHTTILCMRIMLLVKHYTNTAFLIPFQSDRLGGMYVVRFKLWVWVFCDMRTRKLLEEKVSETYTVVASC